MKKLILKTFFRYNYFAIVSVILLILSCSSKQGTKFCARNDHQILDSLNYIVLPDDYYLPKGNDVFKRLIAQRESIKFCLIEKIIDTTASDMRIADSYNYKNGDIAVLLLPFVIKEKFSLRELIFDEFKKELKHKKSDFFESIYYNILFSNSKEKNYENRLRLYKTVKRKYGY